MEPPARLDFRAGYRLVIGERQTALPTPEGGTMFQVEDWMGNVMFSGCEFKTFEDGWTFVRENCPEDDWQDIYVVAVNRR
jgi:hypothetical protein